MGTPQTLIGNGLGARSLREILNQLDRAGSGQFDTSTYASLVRWCGSAKALVDGARVHRHILQSGLGHNTLLLNFLVRMYGSCGALDTARTLFAQLHEPNQHSWNFIISAHARHGDRKGAFRLFAQMERDGLLPNKFVYASILIACAHKAALADGKRIHARARSNGFESDVAVGSGLINMYSKCGTLEDAYGTFTNMPEHNTHSWTAMVTAYANHGHGKDAVHLFNHMQQEGSMPSKITLVSTLPACSSEAFLAEGKRVHACIISNGYESDSVVVTALVNMYAKCGSLEEARILFDGMCKYDEQSWNAIISGYAQHGHWQDALHLHNQMLSEGMVPNKFIFASIISACASPTALGEGKRIHAFIIGSDFVCDPVVGNALVNMYGKCGSLEHAQWLFDKIQDRDRFMWTSMIVALCEHGKGKDALRLFVRMQQEQVKPDEVTFASIFSVCASEATLNEGKLIHAYIVEIGLKVDLAVGNALVSMYSKCGSLTDAESMFDKMAVRDTVSWNAMLAAYAQHGHSKTVLTLFDHMQKEGVSPNDVTFVSVLSACSHTGMIDEGFHYFGCMTRDHGIKPFEDHYNCMLDLFGRAGQLDEAENFILKMPMEPSAISWMTLLCACKTKADLSRGIRYAHKLFQLDPYSSAPYFMLANMYFRVGMEDEAVKVLHTLNKKGLKCRLFESSHMVEWSTEFQRVWAGHTSLFSPDPALQAQIKVMA